jgi:malate dehydrogenase
VVALLKTGSAYYAPAASVAQMVDSILNDRNQVLPCAAYLKGQYGIDGLFVGVPVKLGRRGVSQVVEIELQGDERAAFDRSASAVRELVDAMDRIAASA